MPLRAALFLLSLSAVPGWSADTPSTATKPGDSKTAAAKSDRDKLPERIWQTYDAAEKGNARAQYFVGNYFQYGYMGVKKDIELAMKWYRKAIDQGETDAMMSLARMYLNGTAGRTDHAAAFKLMRAAADKGEPDAYGIMGSCYFEGQGVSKSAPEGLKTLLKGVSLGSSDAAIQLGYRYEYGSGVKQDYTEAYKWYFVASEMGVNVKTLIDNVVSRMSTAQATRAERLAGEYVKANPVKKVPRSGRGVVQSAPGAAPTPPPAPVDPNDPFNKAVVK